MENDPYTQETVADLQAIGSCFSTDAALIAAIVAGVLLMIAAALVSGSKVAFLSINTQQIRTLRKSKKITARTALKFIDKPEELLALTSVLNCINYVAVAILFMYVTRQPLSFLHPALCLVIQVAIITPILLVFCEVMPKMLARQNPDGIIGFMSIPLLIMSKIMKPLTFFVARNNRHVELQIHKNQSISMDELSDVIEENPTGLMSEREMLKGIIEFGNIEVSEIMCPRVDMVAIESKEPFEQVLKKITESGYSRIPVYTDTFDQISGILYIKDLLPYVNNKNGFQWMTLIRPPHFVPENKKINELLEELQMQKNHMAIVVDEYGGTSGLVTMEDIIEMIVGDISDEFDEEESDFTRVDENTYIFKGKTLLSDFCDELEIDSETFAEAQGESESLAGLILEMKGELPRKNERFECCGFEFTVLEVDRRRITSVKVHRKIAAEPAPADQ